MERVTFNALTEAVTVLWQKGFEYGKKALKKRRATVSNSNRVFIVHGHNHEIKLELARTLDKLGLEPIVLHEQVNGGKTIVEKFEANANVNYAIVLLTEDDLGKAKRVGRLNVRARQNVILELGYFIGKLGRSRVCLLSVNGVEMPSDLFGLAYVPIDTAGHWKTLVGKELKNAKYNVDLNLI